MNKEIEQQITQRILELRADNVAYKEIRDIIIKEFGKDINVNALKKRVSVNKGKDFNIIPTKSSNSNMREYETFNADGSRELLRILALTDEQKESQDTIMQELGFNPLNWDLINLTLNVWQQNSTQDGKVNLYQVKVKVKPKVKEVNTEEVLETVQQAIKEGIKPLEFTKKEKDKSLDNNKLMEMPGMELHLGKMSWNGDTGEDYDQKIAQDRFRIILEDILDKQTYEKCGQLVLYIGNDFFNSDTVDNTTTHGTPQQNDLRWKKMFLIGLKLYSEAIATLKEHFNKIDVRLVQGNHDEMSSFYLYVALQQLFLNTNNINFSDNYKRTQAYSFGKCVIFTNHGDANFKRLIKTIAAEFPEEWSLATYREIHLGHLHKEVTVDDDSGIIARRVGSPTATDDWHYSERWIGATQKYQIFIWDKEKGLQDIHFINFGKKKTLVKKYDNRNY